MRKSKFWKRILIFFASLAILFLGVVIYLAIVAIEHPPEVADTSSLKLQRVERSPGFYTIGNNWFRKSKSGLYEMYVEGKPFERGVIAGKLSEELVVRQEDNFNEQINKLIPSKFYLHFLKYFIAWFNRNLAKNVTQEYKQEIYGVSESASQKYDYIGSNYQRLLNYHAAHDIGHSLQSMAMVGCTSFATWDNRSEDSTLIIGRNFDFYVGDKFAEDKIVSFISPANGNKFMFITWGGFMGVVSGMNDKGLTVTINAAKTTIPSGAATPVSLVAREILQYAGNIKEAVAIASRRKMFVSESFLVGSAEDHKAVLIEKTPDSLEVYDSGKDFITCTNHFQSKNLSATEINQQQMKESASVYRYGRLQELLNATEKNSVQHTVDILRNIKGQHDADIGLGNEKAINQFIAHHSVVFEPDKRLVWVSTSPWQFGKFVAYDLNKVFALRGLNADTEIQEKNLTIAEDPFIHTPAFHDFMNYRRFKEMIVAGDTIAVDSLIKSNPSYFNTYVVAGDYYFKRKDYRGALPYYQLALTKEISTEKERGYIVERIEKCAKK